MKQQFKEEQETRLNSASNEPIPLKIRRLDPILYIL